jgi:hypothetical protein
MARGYKATLDVKCWKEHVCCYCGVAYRYVLDKNQTGTGATQTDAVAAARTAAVRSLRNAVAMVPCPACGHYQPDMIGGRRLRQHAIVLLAMTAATFGLFLLAVCDMLPPPAALWLTALCGVPAWLAYIWIGARNPNRSMRANKAVAERLVQQKRLETLSAEGERDERPRPVVVETGIGFFCVGALLLFTTILMLGAEVVRLGSGWPANPDWHPPMFGPGDQAWTWIEPDQPFETLRGEWRFLNGSAKAMPLNKNDPKNVEKIALQISSRDTGWSTPHPADAASPPRLWVRLQFPKNHALSRKRVQIEIAMNIAYPAAEQDRVVDKQKGVTATLEVDMTRPLAAFLYSFFWYTAMLGGGTVYLLAGVYHLLSDAALKKMAAATRVTAMAEENGREAVPVPRADDTAPA